MSEDHELSFVIWGKEIKAKNSRKLLLEFRQEVQAPV